jgi:hypothetical protein
MNFTYILNLLFIPSSIINFYFYNNTTLIEKVSHIRVNDDINIINDDNYYIENYDKDNDDDYLEINDIYNNYYHSYIKINEVENNFINFD